MFDIYQTDIFYCPICNQQFTPVEVTNLRAQKIKGYRRCAYAYRGLVNFSKEIDIFDKLEEYGKQIDAEKNYVENLLYKYKCTRNNTEIYIKIYEYYEEPNLDDSRFLYDNWKNNPEMKQQLLEYRKRYINILTKIEEEEEKRKKKKYNYSGSGNNGNGKISSDGYFRGIRLCGKVKVVSNAADFKVEVVNNWADLKVKKVSHSPSYIGEWEFVDNFEDFKIEYVNNWADFKIEFVDSFPGVC